jgi:hypothetical protein
LAPFPRRVDGKVHAMEERRGNWLDRIVRVSARGREETTPVVLHNLVLLVVVLFAGTVIAIALVLWLVLR